MNVGLFNILSGAGSLLNFFWGCTWGEAIGYQSN